MANRMEDHEPRWTNTGYWTDRGEDEQREGDQRRARDYDRDDQRRYALRSIDQGERMRRMRAQHGAPEQYGYRTGEGGPDETNRSGWQEVDRDELDRRREAREHSRDWNASDEQQRTQRGYNASGNYYGERRRRDAYGEDFQADGFISARGQPSRQRDDDGWDSGERYDTNPGFSDEFSPDRDRYGIADPASDWNAAGPYTGMGPQGYERTDERILEDVNEALTRHRHIDARQIQMDVQNGEVILGGSARNKTEKRLAEDVAASVRGVKDVFNQIKVQK